MRAIDELGRPVARALVSFGGADDDEGRAIGTASLPGLPRGGYAIEVAAPDDPTGDEVVPVRQATVVVDG